MLIDLNVVMICCCDGCQGIYAWLISVCPGDSNLEEELSPSAGQFSTWVRFIQKIEGYKMQKMQTGIFSGYDPSCWYK